jgi:chaperone BCS1
LYGPPGTGKTSLVKAIANEYKMSIYIIDINSGIINDETIYDVLGNLGDSDEKKILLFEDIDSAFSDKEKLLSENRIMITKELTDNTKDDENDDEKGDTKTISYRNKAENKFLTYSGLLNALDGVISNHSGLLTIMTTNYVEKLGNALIRPGRIDVKFELTYCCEQQIIRMIECFCNKISSAEYKKINIIATELAARKIRPCQLQFYLLKYENNVTAILDNINILQYEIPVIAF